MSKPISASSEGRRAVGPTFTPLTLTGDFIPLPGWETPSYAKTTDGFVVVRGAMTTPGGVPTDTVIAQLPIGYRPSAFVICPYDPFGGTIRINPDGEILSPVMAAAGVIGIHGFFLAV